MTPLHVTVVGVLGRFGSVLARRLYDSGCVVSGIDLNADGGRDRDHNFYRYYQAEESSSGLNSTRILELLRDTQVLLLATPTASIRGLILTYGKHIPPGALLVDIASVKTPAVSGMIELARDDIELLSIHPLFGPAADFGESTVVSIEIRSGPRAAEFIDFFRRWGCHVKKLSADEHDLKMAYVQSLCHALVITLGQTGRAEALRLGAPRDMLTPFSHSLFRLLERIGDAGPDLYAAIQIMNPHTLSMIDKYILQLQEFRELVADKDLEGLKKYIASSAGALT